MPLYEYKCEACDLEFSKMLRMDDRDDPLKEECPTCKSINYIYRIYSNGGFVDPGILTADKRMEQSGVQKRLEEIRDHHKDANMKWNG